jgi:hypothetical protein
MQFDGQGFVDTAWGLRVLGECDYGEAAAGCEVGEA